jgi:hypothetical protein
MGIGLKLLPSNGNAPDATAICNAISSMQGDVVEKLEQLTVVIGCVPTDADSAAFAVRIGCTCQCQPRPACTCTA